MKSFIRVTVIYAIGKTREELINVDKIYRVIAQKEGTSICFNSTGSDSITVQESQEVVEKMLS